VISSVVSLIIESALTCVSLVLYLVPLVVGWVRRAPGLGAIAVIDILLGWTLIGWLIALAMALRPARPPSPPPGCLPSAGCAWRAGPGGPPAPRPGSPPPLNLPRRPADPGDPGPR
jgi:Superinfection immunity protein